MMGEFVARTSTANIKAQPYNLESLKSIMQLMTTSAPIPASVNAGSSVIAMLRKLPKAPQTERGYLAAFGGLDIFEDKTMMPDEWEVRDQNGKVMYSNRMPDPYTPTNTDGE